jgi:hypothetical protein
MSGIVLRADSHHLVFLLPALILLPPGRHSPCLHGCTLDVKPGGVVEIQGPSRDVVFAQATRFLKPHLKDRPAFEISATLRTPCRDRFERHFHRSDRWSILCNAGIAFAPTAMPSVLAAG